MREILEDKFVNGFMIAIILGIATNNFINNAGGMILDHVFAVATAPWVWKIFFGQVLLYALAMVAAIIIRRQISPKQ